MRAAWIGLLAVVVLQLTACGAPAPAEIDLVVDRGEHPDETYLRWSVPVQLEGDTRVAISASKPELLEYEETDTEGVTQKMLSGTIPAKFKAVPAALLGPANLVDGNPVAIRTWPIQPGQMGKPFRIPLTVERVIAGQKASVAIWPVPALETRDLETKPVTVPPGRVVRVSIGLEPQCVASLLMPVDVTVSAIDSAGTVVTVGTRALSPFKPEGRNWTDLSFPLDAVAGKEVRFRFGVRLNGPSQLQYALPVFSDPAIVEPTV